MQSVALFIINSHIELCNDCNVLLKTFFCFAKICAHFTWYHSTCYRSNNYSWKYPLHCLKMSSYSFVVSGKITFQMDRFNSGCTVQPGFSENTTTPHRQHQNKESCSFCFIHNNYLHVHQEVFFSYFMSIIYESPHSKSKDNLDFRIKSQPTRAL